MDGCDGLLARVRTLITGRDTLRDRIGALLDAISYVRIVDTAGLERVRRLRHRAYVAAGVADPNPDASLADDYDLAPNAANFALSLDDCFCAAIRLHLVTSANDHSPACAIFPDILLPLIGGGHRLIDPNCFCVDPSLSGKLPELAYLALRLPHIAAEAGPRSMVTATVRPDHMPFYRRILRARLVAEPRYYPGRLRPLGLMLVDFDVERTAIALRNPFFAGRPGEARALGIDRLGHHAPALAAA